MWLQGDIILVNADDVHTGCSELENGWAYRAIYPHPDLFRSISRDIRQPEGSVPWFPDAVLHDPGLAQQLMMTFTLLAQPGNTLFKETMLMSSLTRLMMRHGKTRLTPRELPSAEHRVMAIKELIDSCPERDVSLLELAEIAGLSPWHFLRQFKSVVGIRRTLTSFRLGSGRQRVAVERASHCHCVHPMRLYGSKPPQPPLQGVGRHHAGRVCTRLFVIVSVGELVAKIG